MRRLKGLLIGGILIGMGFVAAGIRLHESGFIWVGIVWAGLAAIPTAWVFLPSELQERLKGEKRNREIAVTVLLGVLFLFGLTTLLLGWQKGDPARAGFGGVFAAIPAGIVAAKYLTHLVFERTWAQLAEQTRLAFEKDPYCVTGTYRGRVIRLDTYRQDEGPDYRGRPREVAYMRITLSINNRSRSSLVLKRKGIVKQYVKKDEGIQVGREDFDRHFTIKCEPEDLASRLFVFPSLRERLMGAWFADIELDGQQLRYRRARVMWNRDKLQALFELLDDLAKAIEAYS